MRNKKLVTFLLWLALIALFVAIFEIVSTKGSAHGLPLRNPATFYKDVGDDSIRTVRPSADSLIVTRRDGTEYRTHVTWNQSVQSTLIDHAVTLEAESSEPSADSSSSSTSTEDWLAVLLAALAFLALVVFLVRRAAARSGANVFGLRKTTARLLTEKPSTRFTDVGGARHAKEQLADIADFLKNPERWHKSGARLPRGVLLEGPPGCGKTLLARALAGEAQAAFFEVSATEFVELFVGVGASRVRDLFEQAAAKAPAIVFIDEIDAVGRRRGAGASGLAHQEREHTLNQLLVSLDGFAKKARVVAIAATNRGDVLDPALLRPGRFDVRIPFAPLSTDERREILAIHTREKPLGSDVDLAALARDTANLTGADLEHLCNTATLKAVRRARRAGIAAPQIEQSDFAQVLDERTRDTARFDKLDAIVIESATQLSQPTGRVVVRVVLDDGVKLEGEVIWVDAGFVKIRTQGGEGVLVSKAQIRRMEPIAGTESHRDAVQQDAWAQRHPDVA